MDRLNSVYVSMLNTMASFRDEVKDRGATGVEYGIMIAAIAAVIIVLAFAIGVKVQAAFQTVDTNLPN